MILFVLFHLETNQILFSFISLKKLCIHILKGCEINYSSQLKAHLASHANEKGIFCEKNKYSNSNIKSMYLHSNKRRKKC